MIAPRAQVWHLLVSESDTDNTIGTTSGATGMETSAVPFLSAGDEKEQPSVLGTVPAWETMQSSSPTVQQRRYGTFHSQWKIQRMSLPLPQGRLRVPLRSSQEVRVEYFNCLGASGDRFSDVMLREEELRPPYFLRKRGAAPMDTRQSGVDLTVLMGQEWKTGEELTTSSNSTNSNLEMCLNWYWIDMVGRDASLRKYKNALRFLTKRFNICESFLIDRDHSIVMPQICASPKVPTQFLVCLRVATPQIALDSDSVLELTNRWIIVVDLNQKLVITIHHMDCACLANMRNQWSSVMKGSNIAFQEFLFKLFHDAVNTYESSLEAHANLLDLCESKLFFSGCVGLCKASREEEHRQDQLSDQKVLSYFANSSHSPFLTQLLDHKSKKPVDKSVMNMFLYHLHCRTNAQYRTLSITQTVLAESFTKLRLCSKEHANQMCVHCIELINQSLEIRDEAKTLLNLHISLQSFRSNELMAVLTKFSVFFTPCSFLAAVYGMNFTRIPEFRWDYGYYYFWIACLGMCLLIYVYMGRRGLLH
ncbi:cation transporter, putative [Trypanosoma cruzi]|nr:cation transporter, putative [Trypanosoma cruzi]